MKTQAFSVLLASVDPDMVEMEDHLPVLKKNGEVLKAAIALARANALYFPFMNRLIRSGVGLPPREREPWARELEAALEFKRTIEVLNEVSRNSGIPYTLIKNGGIIEHVPRDVDILVRPDDRNQFIELLAEHGLNLIHDARSETTLARSGLMKIDVYARIHYLGRDFLGENFLWDSRLKASTHGISHPALNPEASYTLDLIHGLMGHGGITLLDFLDLRGLRRQMKNPGACRAEALAFGWQGAFDLCTAELDTLARIAYEDRAAIDFPFRYGRQFIMRCVNSLDGDSLTPHQRLALDLSLLWDEVVDFSETSGLATILRRSETVFRIANSLGHQLRSMRGDWKGSDHRLGGQAG